MLTKQKIKKLNEEFNALTKAEKRVKIAKDVLAQIKGKKITPKSGSYIILNDNNQFPIKQSVQEVIGDFECQCCALGACLLSTTKFLNKITWNEIKSGELDSRSKSWKLFKGLFTPKQLLMIETAFEVSTSWSTQRVGSDYFNGELDRETYHKCRNFVGEFDNDEERLIAIMKNIIKNKGIFKP